jgi:hypothetical protein
VQVGTSPYSPLVEGGRLCLHLYKLIDDFSSAVPALTTWVHACRHSYDPCRPADVKCSFFAISSHTLSEQLEVATLAGQERIRLEVRNDHIDQNGKAPRLPLERSVASVRSDGSTTEVLLHEQQNLRSIAVLTD